MIQQWRRRDNLIYAQTGTAWPYCLSMSAALPENMRGFAFDMVMRQDACLCAFVRESRLLTRRRCSDCVNVLEAARGSD